MGRLFRHKGCTSLLAACAVDPPTMRSADWLIRTVDGRMIRPPKCSGQGAWCPDCQRTVWPVRANVEDFKT